MSHIHPALRVALLSWLIARGGRYLALWAQGRAPHEHLAIAQDSAMPVDRLLIALQHITGPLALTVIAEGVALLAILSIYNFCRKDTLPQTAERATWLFALSPVLWCDFGAESIGACFGLLALASAVHGRTWMGCIAAVIATWCMPTVAIMTPALVGLSMRARQPQTPAWAPWVVGLSPVIALTTLVFAGFMLAGIGDISLRSVASSPHALRSLEALHAGITPSLDDALFGLGLLGAVACAWRFVENTPRSWPWLTIPLMCWPLLHANSGGLAPLLIMAAPLFAYAAKLTEDPARERPLLAICLMLSMLYIL